jgi:ubiquinone/menaquinone biosynthesis C-methylase UbiE
MGFYSTYIFPRLINSGMSRETTARYRKPMLMHARGEILEIGFGTGLNLPFYPPHVEKLYTVDVNAGMSSVARRNIEKSSIEVEHHTLNAETLPFADESFDTVVSTWTLCSIKDTTSALREIYRVLKPTGKFIFIEHGLSNEAHIRKWQNRLTPVQRVIADGCHLNRNIEVMVKNAGFSFELLEKSYAEGVPKIGGYLYRGIAVKGPAL